MFREEMNLLIEISKDADIVLKRQPSVEEVEAFAEETGNGPELKPMRLCFDVKMSHAWNGNLAEQFVSRFMRYHDLGESDEALLHELFTARYISLKRQYQEWQLKRGEDTVQRAKRVKEKHEVKRQLVRKDTRRNTVSQVSVFRMAKLTSWIQLHADREDIAMGNRAEGGGKVDPVWNFLFKAIRILGREGMSSDESGGEGSGPPYYIRVREWRSRELIPYLQMIDREKRQTNAYGNRRSGNTARERQRVAAGGLSTRRAIAGLPLNFYDKTWYAGLSARDRALLNAKPDMDMPVLVRYD
jgi:hypothetical protein